MQVPEPLLRYAPINLISLSDLEFRLGEDRSYLRTLAANISAHYSPFQRCKDAKPYQRVISTKLRSIDNPSDELKRIQRKIARKLLGHLDVPDFLYGAVKGRTIHDNAAAHHGAKLIVKMDIKSYYPSVTNDHIYRVWRFELGCSREVSNLLTRLTTYERHLPQGAPTSSVLANIYLASVIQPILRQCAQLDVKPGAFVDDLIFSGSNARSLMEPTRKLLGRSGFSFSAKKREILTSRDEKLVTGIRDGKDGPRAPRRKLSDLRAGFHKLKLGVIPEAERADYIKRLAARVSHIRTICEKDAAKYVKLLDDLRGSPRRTKESQGIASSNARNIPSG
jgi:RNA-directed DNA polymerase